MIGTHTVKLVNSKAQQDALIANIQADLPDYFITSKTTNITKRYYACPRNAADMRAAKEQSALVNAGNINPDIYIPDIQDARELKQLLLPLNKWQVDDYLNITPVESLGLLREVWLRTKKLKVYSHYHVLEPTPAARSNHSELLLDQAGNVALLKRGVKLTQRAGIDASNTLQMTCRVQNMNISSGFVAYGHPAVTGIGGMAHHLERKTEQAIEFAFGFKNMNFNSPRKGTYYKGKRKGTTTKELIRPFITNELTGTGDMVLLFKSDDLDTLQSELNKITRIAGGSVFDVEFKALDNEPPAIASYVSNATDAVKIDPNNHDIADALAHAIFMYQHNSNAYSINQTGYAFLETPKQRKNVRNTLYKHAWVEPIFTLTKQVSFSDKCWWTRQDMGGYVIWL